MKWRRFFHVFTALVILLWVAGLAQGQTTTQSFSLQAGWNAIFLEVEPESTAPADVFSGINGLQSVWMWDPQTGTVEFIQDPNEMNSDKVQWLVYYPGNQVASNLHAIHGNTAYLINVSSATTLVVSGEPLIPWANWKANSFNLVGFHLEQGNEPFFGDFFSSSPAHAGQDIYVLDNLSGTWTKVIDPATTTMKKGEGFWIYCKGSSTFTGPVSVKPEQSGGLLYGKQLTEQDLVVYNNSASDKTVSLSVSGLGANLYYWSYVEAEGMARWVQFPSPLGLSIRAGDFQKIRLGVKRAGLTADNVYQANMTVKDSEGTSILIPMSVTGISYAGLWVGNATINKVNEPLNAGDPTQPLKTGSEFSFRIIVHVDDSNNAKLLSQVIQMWQQGTWKPDPNDLGKLIVDQPGHFVLLASDGQISDYYGAALRDGRPVGRRISAPAFPRITPSERALGTFNPASGNSMSTTIVLAADDPTNPFRHLYHPDHKVAAQSYEVTRYITLTMSDVDAEGNPIPGIFEMTQGSSQIGGIYEETLTGLHRDPLYIKGTFLLHKVSDVATLIE